MRLFLLLFSFALCLPRTSQAKETCPWINDATASGFLDGNVTTEVSHTNNVKDDANCEFTHREGSVVTVLRIEVETMADPAGSFPPYAARCGEHAAPVKAIGNQAFACGFDAGKKKVAEQIVGRVRERAFTVRITSNANAPDRAALRNKAQKVAEQVAGFLF